MILISCVNIKYGRSVSAPIIVMLLMMVNMAVAGYVEEIIFRGFLFRAMEKDNLKFAVIVSAITFGAGHIVNLANTADTFGVFMQVFYAIAIGFMFTVIAYKGGSLWPCILSHMFVNGSSVFAVPTSNSMELATSIGIIVISGCYAYWLWNKKDS
ncbi:MAG: CPBP family intramembrane glutamic endopeptidase [Eubacterium sp.]|nr:CPBP family intramembrane glutamic endopeptidase [Eubacterium sp.]